MRSRPGERASPRTSPPGSASIISRARNIACCSCPIARGGAALAVAGLGKRQGALALARRRLCRAAAAAPLPARAALHRRRGDAALLSGSPTAPIASSAIGPPSPSASRRSSRRKMRMSHTSRSRARRSPWRATGSTRRRAIWDPRSLPPQHAASPSGIGRTIANGWARSSRGAFPGHPRGRPCERRPAAPFEIRWSPPSGGAGCRAWH